jgi:Protein of unknown function (DUF2946)
MKLKNRKLIHWIAVFSIVMSALAPAVSQGVSAEQGISMEICSVDGTKMIQLQQDGSPQVDQHSQTCPYCITHASIPPALNTNLKFEAPQSFALIPQLYYQSPRPLFTWLTPPSAAPPANT